MISEKILVESKEDLYSKKMIEQATTAEGTAEIDEKAFIGRKQKKVKKKRKNMPIFGMNI